MEIIFGLDKARQNKDSVITVGSFDGIHRGHIKIIEKLLNVAAQKSLNSCLITFEPHPKTVIMNSNFRKGQIITTLDEKIEILNELNLDNIFVLKFTRDFSQMSYRDFVVDILINKFKMKHMVIGYDHAFGKNREGSFEDLVKLSSEFDFGLNKVDPYTLNGETVSSTLIRELLNNGNVGKVRQMLGHFHFIKGIIIRGDGRGRHLKFPTANIQLKNDLKLLPKEGVYAVNCEVCNEKFRGMANIGYKPTFGGLNKTLEVHIFDFNHDIYGEKLKVDFIKRLRNEKKFGTKEELMHQLEIDKKESFNINTEV